MMLFSILPAACVVLVSAAYLALTVGYGFLIGGQRFIRVWSLPSAAALVAIVAIMEVTVRFDLPILFFVAGLVAFVAGMACYDAANRAGADITSSILTDWYSALYPEVCSLLTVRDKIRAAHTARLRLVGTGKTMFLLVMWYMLPWIAMHAALRIVDIAPSDIADIVLVFTVPFALFVGMHFVFRSPIRAHIRDFIRERDAACAAHAKTGVPEPSEEGDGAAGRADADDKRHAR